MVINMSVGSGWDTQLEQVLMDCLSLCNRHIGTEFSNDLRLTILQSLAHSDEFISLWVHHCCWRVTTKAIRQNVPQNLLKRKRSALWTTTEYQTIHRRDVLNLELDIHRSQWKPHWSFLAIPLSDLYEASHCSSFGGKKQGPPRLRSDFWLKRLLGSSFPQKGLARSLLVSDMWSF